MKVADVGLANLGNAALDQIGDVLDLLEADCGFTLGLLLRRTQERVVIAHFPSITCG